MSKLVSNDNVRCLLTMNTSTFSIPFCFSILGLYNEKQVISCVFNIVVA